MRAFRKYHRYLAIALCIPLLVTVLSGIGYTLFDEWLKQEEIGEFLLKVHTFEILHLETIYPLLNGLGAIGLLITGISMTGLGKKRRET